MRVLLLVALCVTLAAVPAAAAYPGVIQIIVFCPGTMNPTCPPVPWAPLWIGALAVELLFPSSVPVAPPSILDPHECGGYAYACQAARAQGL